MACTTIEDVEAILGNLGSHDLFAPVSFTDDGDEGDEGDEGNEGNE